MSVKSWMLGRVHRIGGVVARGDLPPRDPTPDTPLPALQAPVRAPDALGSAAHLGAYASLVGAIRDELEHFVASHLRLHLAIADRDRFILTSIEVRCRDAGAPRQLLREFVREFKPEQVKRYLAREVIAGLPNAAAIDLAQFAGLVDSNDSPEAADDDSEYRELIEALRSTPAAAPLRPYEVNVVGRWAEIDATRPAAASVSRAATAVPGTPTTPLAGQRCEFDVEDADGRRRVVLPAVVPGRRYVIGKGESCDVRVNATYASRRHAEVWLDNGAWWVADAGSTNGIRVEPTAAARDRGGAIGASADAPLPLAEGARIVLSARAEGPAHDYPWLALRAHDAGAARITPIAVAAPAAAPKTPLTSVQGRQPGERVFKLGLVQDSGVRTLELRPDALPLGVGRSRNQSLVVDRRHESVSGHHLDITALDDEGAAVEVHGDNGVWIDGVRHGPGARLRWTAGHTMWLGAGPQEPQGCSLTLTALDQD